MKTFNDLIQARKVKISQTADPMMADQGRVEVRGLEMLREDLMTAAQLAREVKESVTPDGGVAATPTVDEVLGILQAQGSYQRVALMMMISTGEIKPQAQLPVGSDSN